MLLAILNNLGEYLQTNSGDFLANYYHHTTREERLNREGALVEFPAFWENSAVEPKPLLQDQLRNYIYFRVNGETTISDGLRFTSCKKTQDNIYPVRMVCHYKEKRNGRTTEAISELFARLLQNYMPSNTSDLIQHISITVTGKDTSRYTVWDDETTQERKPLRTDDKLFFIDFDLLVRVPAGTCIEDIDLCNLPESIEQIGLCPEPEPCEPVTVTELQDGSTQEIPSGGSYSCDNRNVTITDSDGVTVVEKAPGTSFACAVCGAQNFTEAGEITWQSLTNTVVDASFKYGNENVLEKTSATSAPDAGAESVEQITPGKKLVLPLWGIDAQALIGIQNGAFSPGVSNHTHAFLFVLTANRIDIREGGSTVVTNAVPLYRNEDFDNLLEIRYDGTNITYWHNGGLLYTSAITYTSQTLYVATSLYYERRRVLSAKILNV